MGYSETFTEDTSKTRTNIQERLDMSKVDAIVSRIKDKYEKQGLLGSEETSNLKELRSLISEGKRGKIEILKPQDLSYNFNPTIRGIGKIYNKFSSFFGFISKKVFGMLPESKLLAYDLYSADMNYSVSQYLAIASVLVFFVDIVLITAMFIVFLLFGMSFLIPLLLSIFLIIGSVYFALKYPESVAKQRARKIDTYLPFALRHMATLLRAGTDLYKVVRMVAVTDYGVLSEELTRTVMEVEEGQDIKDALRALSLRTKSFALKNAITHLLRALKSGGNLSEAMSSIADDVSFQIMSDIDAYAGKLNFFGVIYIFIGIVVPVMLAILSGIRNAPLGSAASFFSALPLTPLIIGLIFLILYPIIFFVLISYIKSIRPNML
jgi:flagellar protein FlaJ